MSETHGKLKAHEFAKTLAAEYGRTIETRDVLAWSGEIGEHITNPQSWVTPEQQEKLRAHLRSRTGDKERKAPAAAPGKVAGKDVMALLKRAHDAATAKPRPAGAVLVKKAAPAPAPSEPAPVAAPVAEAAPAPAPVVETPAPPAPTVEAAPAAAAPEPVEEPAPPEAPESPAPRPPSVEPLPPPKLRVVLTKANATPPAPVPVATPPVAEEEEEPVLEEAAAPAPAAEDEDAPSRPPAVEPMALPKLRIKKDEPRVVVLKKMDAPSFTLKDDRPGVSSAVVAMPAPGAPGPRATARPGQRRAPPPPPSGGRAKRDRRLSKEEFIKQREENRLNEMAQVVERAKAAGEVIYVREGITVKDLADKLGVKVKDVIQKLFLRRLMATINQTLNEELIKYTCAEFGRLAEIVSFEDELVMDETVEESGETAPRAPVVTVMGHVDHGKSSLLESIHAVDITSGEAGGITQHIGAYRVDTGDGKPVTFIDTPGHEAFTMMRARGAKVTDIVILVVAADDGVMPQTIEAIHHAQAAKVPIIVAVNKIDKPGAEPERIKQQLSHHNLFVEGYGGDTPVALVSAKKKQGIKELLELVHLTADLKQLKAAIDKPARAAVLEARLDKARGPVATLIVQEGTLREGDVFVCGSVMGRVRAMFDDKGQRIESAGPSVPVEVLGFMEVAAAGDALTVVEDEAKARQIANYRLEQKKNKQKGKGAVSLDDLFSKAKQGEIKELPVIIKADTDGSVEVLKSAIAACASEEIGVRVLHAATGGITETDINLAAAAGAIIIGFNSRPDRKAVDLAEQQGVDIRLHSIIYKVTDEIKAAMQGLIKPKEQETLLGRAEIREVFKISKLGNIAGCMVTEGKVTRAAQVRLLRGGVVVFTGKLSSLKRFKDDVGEVRSGFDCGMNFERFGDFKVGDQIEAFIIETVAPGAASTGTGAGAEAAN